MLKTKINLTIGIFVLIIPVSVGAATSTSFKLYDDQTNFAQYNFGDSTSFNLNDSGQTWELRPRSSTNFKIVASPPAAVSSSAQSSVASSQASDAGNTDNGNGGGRREETLNNYQNGQTTDTPDRPAAPESSASSSAQSSQQTSSVPFVPAESSISTVSSETSVPDYITDIIREIEPGDIVRSESGAIVVTTGTGQQIVIIAAPSQPASDSLRCSAPLQTIVYNTFYPQRYLLVMLLLIVIAMLLLLYREYRLVLAELHQIEKELPKPKRSKTTKRKKRA